jgi:hypothetical protein
MPAKKGKLPPWMRKEDASDEKGTLKKAMPAKKGSPKKKAAK